MQYPSKLVEDAVIEFSKLPGIGKKSALRFVLHLLKVDEQRSIRLAEAVLKLRTETMYCSTCYSISDSITCKICASLNREKNTVCVVEDSKDILSFENTAQYNGLYHVLGGLISPISGIGPDALHINSLLERVKKGEISEVIFALKPDMEGDTTIFYLQKKLAPYNLKLTTIARGIPIGMELEHSDEITLGRSILKRTNYDI